MVLSTTATAAAVAPPTAQLVVHPLSAVQPMALAITVNGVGHDRQGTWVTVRGEFQEPNESPFMEQAEGESPGARPGGPPAYAPSPLLVAEPGATNARTTQGQADPSSTEPKPDAYPTLALFDYHDSTMWLAQLSPYGTLILVPAVILVTQLPATNTPATMPTSPVAMPQDLGPSTALAPPPSSAKHGATALEIQPLSRGAGLEAAAGDALPLSTVGLAGTLESAGILADSSGDSVSDSRAFVNTSNADITLLKSNQSSDESRRFQAGVDEWMAFAVQSPSLLDDLEDRWMDSLAQHDTDSGHSPGEGGLIDIDDPLDVATSSLSGGLFIEPLAHSTNIESAGFVFRARDPQAARAARRGTAHPRGTLPSDARHVRVTDERGQRQSPRPDDSRASEEQGGMIALAIPVPAGNVGSPRADALPPANHEGDPTATPGGTNTDRLGSAVQLYQAFDVASAPNDSSANSGGNGNSKIAAARSVATPAATKVQ